MSNVNMWEIENGLFSEDIKIICGVDEAGRGPLAGPVCAAAVILPRDLEIPGLTDSKKLTDKKRRELFPVIQEKAIAWGIGLASEQEIDEIKHNIKYYQKYLDMYEDDMKSSEIDEYEDLIKDLEEELEEYEENYVIGRKGKMVWRGTVKAIKATK